MTFIGLLWLTIAAGLLVGVRRRKFAVHVADTVGISALAAILLVAGALALGVAHGTTCVRRRRRRRWRTCPRRRYCGRIVRGRRRPRSRLGLPMSSRMTGGASIAC